MRSFWEKTSFPRSIYGGRGERTKERRSESSLGEAETLKIRDRKGGHGFVESLFLLKASTYSQLRHRPRMSTIAMS